MLQLPFESAKDELDAANNVVVDKSEIRAVIDQYDQFGQKKNALFGTTSGSGAAGDCGASADIIVLDKSAYEGLDKDGSPVLMQMEINKSKQIKEKEKKAAGSTKKKGAKK